MVWHGVNAQVCVVGGGPAGASAARRLARLGHSVVLIEKSPFPRAHIGESLTGGVLPLLEVLQLRSEIEQQGFLRVSKALIQWAGHAEERYSDGVPGFQVDRSRFDEIILKAAESAGATILQPARIINSVRTPGGRWAIHVRKADGDTTRVDCDWLIDATGRTSSFGGRKSLNGAPTIALYAYWRNSAIIGSQTRVEAGGIGWYWGAPLPNGLFNATVFVDPVSVMAQSIEALYHRLIASSELLRGCLDGSRSGRVQVCDATCASDDEPIRDGLVKAGESAFTIDPLSSQGVQTAIGSALHAATVIHTILERPATRTLAEEFYRERQRRSVLTHRAAAARLYSETPHRTEFWLRRSPDETTQNGAAKPRVELKPETVLRLNPCAQLREVPVVEDSFVTAATAVLLPEMPDPLVFIDGVKVTPLVQVLDRPMRCDHILASWAPFATPPTALRILRVLVGSCIVVLHANVPDARSEKYGANIAN